jgi:hypothetical protein
MSNNADYDEFEEEPVTARSLVEADALRRELVKEVQSIQAQLGDHGLDDETGGYRMDLAEWEAWRRRAKWALRHKIQELQEVNAWIKDHHQSQVQIKAVSEMTTGELAQTIRAMADELAIRARQVTTPSVLADDSEV